MKYWKITIEPISPEAKRRSTTGARTFECESMAVMASSTEAKDDHGRLVSIQLATIGPRQMVARSIYEFLRDAQNAEIRSDLARLILADMLGESRTEVVERHEGSHGAQSTPNMQEELLAALFSNRRGPRS